MISLKKIKKRTRSKEFKRKRNQYLSVYKLQGKKPGNQPPRRRIIRRPDNLKQGGRRIISRKPGNNKPFNRNDRTGNPKFNKGNRSNPKFDNRNRKD